MKDLIIMIEMLKLFDKLSLDLEQQSIVHNVIMEFRDQNLKKQRKMSKKEIKYE